MTLTIYYNANLYLALFLFFCHSQYMPTSKRGTALRFYCGTKLIAIIGPYKLEASPQNPTMIF